MKIKLRLILLYLGFLRIVTLALKAPLLLLYTILKPLDWLRQGWRILQRKIFNPPIVFFLDFADKSKRVGIVNITNPIMDTEQLHCALKSPRFVVTNLARNGSKLDYFVIRHSTARPHFYSSKCFEGAIVYGTSDWTSPEAVSKYYDNYQEDTISIGEL